MNRKDFSKIKISGSAQNSSPLGRLGGAFQHEDFMHFITNCNLPISYCYFTSLLKKLIMIEFGLEFNSILIQNYRLMNLD